MYYFMLNKRTKGQARNFRGSNSTNCYGYHVIFSGFSAKVCSQNVTFCLNVPASPKIEFLKNRAAFEDKNFCQSSVSGNAFQNP